MSSDGTHSEHLEMCVLHACLNDNAVLSKDIDPELFTGARRSLFRDMKRMHESGLTFDWQDLVRRKDMDRKLIAKVSDYEASNDNLDHVIDELMVESQGRVVNRLIRGGDRLGAANYLTTVAGHAPYKRQLASDYIEEYLSSEKSHRIVIPGFPQLSKKLVIKPGESTLIAAQSGVGKSSLAQNIALQFVKAGKDVVLVSFEMNYDAVLNRMMANLLGVTKEQLDNRDLTPHQRELMVEKAQMLDRHLVFVYIERMTPQQAVQVVARHIEETDSPFVLWDHLAPMDRSVEAKKSLEDLSYALNPIIQKYKVGCFQFVQAKPNEDNHLENYIVANSNDLPCKYQNVLYLSKGDMIQYSSDGSLMKSMIVHGKKARDGVIDWKLILAFNAPMGIIGEIVDQTEDGSGIPDIEGDDHEREE